MEYYLRMMYFIEMITLFYHMTYMIFGDRFFLRFLLSSWCSFHASLRIASVIFWYRLLPRNVLVPHTAMTTSMFPPYFTNMSGSRMKRRIENHRWSTTEFWVRQMDIRIAANENSRLLLLLLLDGKLQRRGGVILIYRYIHKINMEKLWKCCSFEIIVKKC